MLRFATWSPVRTAEHLAKEEEEEEEEESGVEEQGGWEAGVVRRKEGWKGMKAKSTKFRIRNKQKEKAKCQITGSCSLVCNGRNLA